MNLQWRRVGKMFLTVIAAIVVVSFVWGLVAAQRGRERERRYAATVKAYASVLKPGMSRADVEDYLRSHNTPFDSDRDSNADVDLVKIGPESSGVWYCEPGSVYVAFEFVTPQWQSEGKRQESAKLVVIRLLKRPGACI